ncbi:MAG: polyketide synthase family protein, partial [Cyanobacteria bacterium RYN_339]|nr:polyketide synthase family protein [Cyanobacteria bacterium RYN_339]
ARSGEGGAMLVLKRLEDAVAAGDRVYAVVDGLGAGDYAGALRKALAEAGVAAGAVGYLEGHGSGDPHEDDHEARALARVFPTTGAPTTALGSVKATIGHVGAAAGLASVAKAALCLYQELLPPLPGFREPQAALHGSALHVPHRAQYWTRDRLAGPRRAAVTAIGVDGGCAATVLGAFEDLDRLPAATRERIAAERVRPLGRLPEALFLVSGQTPADLIARLQELQREPAGPVTAIAPRWCHPTPAALRLSIVAGTHAELQTRCGQAIAHLRERPNQPLGEVGPIAYAPRPLGPDAQVAYVFPGSGAHYPGMGLELGAWFPEVLRAQDAATGRLAGQLRPAALAPWRLTWPAGWEAEVQAGLADQHQALLLGQVGFGAIAHDLVKRFGPPPAAIIGYCLGETAGFVATRTWADRDELFRRMDASPLFTRDLAGPCEAARKTWACLAHERVDWVMGLVDRPRAVVEAALAGVPRAYLLIVNAPTECVIGGDRDAIEQALKRLDGTFREIPGVTSVHCEVVQAVGDAYRALHHHATTPPADVRFYSGAYGESYAVTPDSAADAVLAQATGTFDYVRLVERAYADGVQVFLEMGPRRSCTRMTKAILGEREHRAMSVSGREHELRTLLMGLGQVFVEGLPVDIAGLYGGEGEKPRGPVTVVRLGGAPFVVPKLVPVVAAAPVMASAVPVRGVAAVLDARPLHALALANQAGAEAHDAFLRLAQTQMANQMAMLAHQQQLLAALAHRPVLAVPAPVQPVSIPVQPVAVPVPPVPAPVQVIAAPGPFMDRAACLAYATGAVGPILGPRFAGADAYPTRVRLPDEPLMLVDRIMEVTGEPLSMTHGTVITEHDVLPGAWYLDGGRIPTCIAVEAGQADLFLSGWLGIDFETRGLACYRLLDAVVTFHAPLPGPGAVIRYDIAIERFARQGDTWIFFFHFEAVANGKPLMSMSKGCAGFFTPEHLASGKGIVYTALDLAELPGKTTPDWRPLLPLARETYDDAQLDRLRVGDLAGCFGPAFAGLPLQTPARLPGDKMRLVHRITAIEPTGGRFGLGAIEGEADIHADDWFITCHFVDDMVMPGTLMYECCCHTLRVLLFRMGWVGEQDQVVYEPVPGVVSQLKCRGQVLAHTQKVTYRITVKELGYEADGTPYVLADALMLADGKPIVHIGNMSVRASGLKKVALEAMWQAVAPPPAAATSPARGEGAMAMSPPPGAGEVPGRAEGVSRTYGPETILAYATGKPSEAFGDRYLPFDTDRIIARLPGPPYMFLDRVTDVQGEPWVLKAGASCIAHYDVPPDEWYFAEEGQPTMPFAVLLEIGLQPCGWLAGYVGSALTSEEDLSFRNLGGQFVQHRPVTPDAGTLQTAVTLTKVSQSGGMIIQEYALEVSCQGLPVYSGTTSFGFFTKAALAQQVGVRGAALYDPTQDELQRAVPLSLTAGRMPVPGDMLRMNDGVELYIPDGGPHGLGYVRGYKDVDPKEWFFAAHFYQDPVCPGSLGLEAMVQLMKQVAAQYHRGTFEVMPAGHAHSWIYRGQILPTNKRAVVEAVIKRVEPDLIVADGLLCVDGLPIYQMTDFAVRIV